jgi:hypothetical protein
VTLAGPHQMVPNLLFDPVANVREAPARMADRKVLHPAPQHRVDFRNHLADGPGPMAAENLLERAQERRPLFPSWGVPRGPEARACRSNLARRRRFTSGSMRMRSSTGTSRRTCGRGSGDYHIMFGRSSREIVWDRATASLLEHHLDKLPEEIPPQEPVVPARDLTKGGLEAVLLHDL